MRTRHLVVALAALLGLSLAGCASAPQPAPAPSQPTLSEEAKAALAQAEADVQAARAAFTLWVPAEEGLKRARAAALSADSARVIEAARTVSDLCRISAQQAGYASTEMP